MDAIKNNRPTPAPKLITSESIPPELNKFTSTFDALKSIKMNDMRNAPIIAIFLNSLIPQRRP